MRQRNWITKPRRSQHHAHVMDYWHYTNLAKERIARNVIAIIHERAKEANEEDLKKAG
jgi:hypothetical protein